MLALRILTIIFSFAGLLCGGILVGAGALDEPSPDTGAIWIGVGMLLYFIANLYLLYRSYKKKHRPTHWVAFILALLPALFILGLLLISDVVDEFF